MCKKIGILAYHSACNFGANLQVFSTVSYLANHGYSPLVINWIPADLEIVYHNQISVSQKNAHDEFVKKHLQITNLCRSEQDIADVIVNENIEAVIIGSDAVAQHHPFLSRIFFPSHRIISIAKYTSDRIFPNPFWGTFLPLLSKKIPIIYLSASSQNSAYKYIDEKVKADICGALCYFSYISVRDSWTQKMFSHITNKDRDFFPITPDPVFAFNNNTSIAMPSREEILEKYDLPNKYILVSFTNSRIVSQSWLHSFMSVAKEQGYTCVAFPFPAGILFKHPFEKDIPLPLPPLDWYALIRYASGYVGQNMHPIVVSLHNVVPFFSFDNYGISYLKCFVNKKSSKIFHILEQADFLENHFSALGYFKCRPTPQSVFDHIRRFDKDKCATFAAFYYKKYQVMMDNICKVIESNPLLK